MQDDTIEPFFDPETGLEIRPRPVRLGLVRGMPCLIDVLSGQPLELGQSLQVNVSDKGALITWKHKVEASEAIAPLPLLEIAGGE